MEEKMEVTAAEAQEQLAQQIEEDEKKCWMLIQQTLRECRCQFVDDIQWKGGGLFPVFHVRSIDRGG